MNTDKFYRRTISWFFHSFLCLDIRRIYIHFTDCNDCIIYDRHYGDMLDNFGHLKVDSVNYDSSGNLTFYV